MSFKTYTSKEKNKRIKEISALLSSDWEIKETQEKNGNKKTFFLDYLNIEKKLSCYEKLDKAGNIYFVVYQIDENGNALGLESEGKSIEKAINEIKNKTKLES